MEKNTRRFSRFKGLFWNLNQTLRGKPLMLIYHLAPIPCCVETEALAGCPLSPPPAQTCFHGSSIRVLCLSSCPVLLPELRSWCQHWAGDGAGPAQSQQAPDMVSLSGDTGQHLLGLSGKAA